MGSCLVVCLFDLFASLPKQKNKKQKRIYRNCIQCCVCSLGSPILQRGLVNAAGTVCCLSLSLSRLISRSFSFDLLIHEFNCLCIPRTPTQRPAFGAVLLYIAQFLLALYVVFFSFFFFFLFPAYCLKDEEEMLREMLLCRVLVEATSDGGVRNYY